MSAQQVLADLKQHGRPHKEELFQNFFRAIPGGYGGKDRFFVVKVPETRAIAKKYRSLDFPELKKLINSEWHEARLLALIILTERALKANEKDLAKIAGFYLKNRKGVNNWDLVDTSARQVVGRWLFSRWPKEKTKVMKWLRKMAASKNLWDRRIAVIATFWFIGQRVYEPSLILCEDLLHDEHDLIHKATGWMLREVGNRDLAPLRGFLKKHAAVMPRTMLRYSIEKLSPAERAKWMGMAKNR
jgi:3-methyladenine DNA glycosylase AlkD